MKPPVKRKVHPDIRIHTAATSLTQEDYTKFYDICLTRNVAGAETLRQLIREEYERIKDSLDIS